MIASIASFSVGNLVGQRSGGGGEDAEVVVAPSDDGAGEGEGAAGAIGAGAAAPGGTPRYAIPVTAAQPSKGPANALVTMVVFSEFQCPFCSRMIPITEQMLREYPTQVRVVWRNLPLGFHPNAMPAAEAAMEAFAQGGNEKFWRLHDILFQNQRELTRENLDRWAGEVGLDMTRYRAAMDGHTHQRAIEADAALAAQIGAQGTPNSFINGIQVTGAQPFEAFKAIIDAEIANAQRLIASGTPAANIYAAVTRGGLTRAAPAAAPGAQPGAAPQQARPQPDPNAVYRVPVEGRLPQQGPDDALVTLVLFSEFQCPFCSRVEPTVTRIVQEYGRDVRVVWMNNPLGFHPNAMPAAIAAMEAFEQGGNAKFWALHALLFEHQADLSRPNIETYAQQAGLNMAQLRAALDNNEHQAIITAQQQLAQGLGASGTPSFFINGRNLRGAQPFEAFKMVIDEELAKARALVAAGTPRARVYAETIRNGHTTQQMLAAPAGAAPGAAAPAAAPARPTRVELAIPAGAPSKGPANAPVVIQEISDYQCPFCSRVLPTIEQLMAAFPNQIRLVWRDLPLPFHPNAHIAAQAAREVQRQGGDEKFWAYNAKLFENQRDLTRETLERLATELGGINMAQFRQALDTERHKAAVDADLAAAQAVGINGTPGFVINGTVISGAVPYEQFEAAVRAALAAR
ncbi:MAG: thioredoxin domain-containing protein [Sandaracinaceae bacterium]|nr:thioredoxin domain-containing protein [Sandaracinaceae bacterium]MBK6808128.1 thioredoxin domain-containing protein [Sandaracinaceae bacterium]MBK7151033.1 thioredoxin domain-containing protein [Sandaracinaceae bacterium]MBK7773152.1 thioredoxin domain-containing protein [Sandaracinaceae bacterium]MBP7685821.1 thioredoxin domain-containing protein [Deltaproteobacteria bacterium]